MSLTTNIAQSNGAGNTVTDLGNSGNLSDFKADDTTGISDYSSNSVSASDTANLGYSKEFVWRIHLTGTASSASQFKFWRSTGYDGSTNDSVVGVDDYYGVSSTYTQPTSNQSSVATLSVPTSSPGSQNISIAGNMSGSLNSFPAFTDYVYQQVHLSSLAPEGDIPADGLFAIYNFSFIETP